MPGSASVIQANKAVFRHPGNRLPRLPQPGAVQSGFDVMTTLRSQHPGNRPYAAVRGCQLAIAEMRTVIPLRLD